MATLKRSIASLIGGIATGALVFILWMLIAGTASPLAVGAGLVAGGLVGTWVRLADL